MDDHAMSLPLSLPPEAFARHAAALRALARTLLRDPADVEDVVQETWIAALESPPAKLEALGGWLATVLRRRASNRRRSVERRARHESLAQRPATFDPRETEQREATLQAVVAALGALDEPLKQVVLLRYFENLPPREIALRLGVEPRVVYDRLQRAHVRLRWKLEREFGSARALNLALGALCGDEAGQAAAEPGARASAEPAWPAAPLAIGAAAALSLTLLLVALRQGSRRDAGESGSSAAAAAFASSNAAPTRESDSVAALDSAQLAGASREPVASDEREESARDMPLPPHEFELELTLLDHLDRSDASTAVFAGPAGGTLNLVGSTDANGRCTLRTRAWGASVELDLALGADGVVRRIALAAGKQSVVLRAPFAQPISLDDLPLVEPDKAGRLARAADVLSTRLESTHASSDATGHLTFIEPLLAFGAREQRGDPDAPPDEVIEFSEENFVISMNYAASEASADTGAAARQCRVAGVVLNSDGAAQASVVVSLRRADEGGWTSRSSDEHGAFEFKGLEPGEYVVQASGDELGAAHGRLALAAGQRVTWDARLERGEVFEGELVDVAGHPLRGWSVEVEGARGADLARTDAGGRFRIANAPSGALRVLARPIVLPAVPPLVLARGAYAADGPRRFTLEFAGEKPLGELRLFIPELSSQADGDRASSDSTPQPRLPRRNFEVRVWRVDSQLGASPLWSEATDNPRFLRAMLLPGEYRVEVLLAGRELREVAPVFITAGGVSELPIALSPGACVEFTSPATSEPAHVVLLRRGASFDALMTLPGINAHIAELRPGAYSVWNALSGRWLANFEAQAGATLQVQLAPTTR